MKVLAKGEYFGQQHAALAFEGIVLSQYAYSEKQTAWHYHENPYFMYVLQGNMLDVNKQHTTFCPSGSLMFNNWQEMHYGAKESGFANGFHLEFERTWLAKQQVDCKLVEGSQLIQHPEIHFLIARMYYEFLCADPYNEVSIQLLLLQLVETLSRQQKSDKATCPNWVTGLKEILHDDSEQLNLQYLSSQLDIHPVHLSRSATKYLSCSLGAYIRQEKLKRAIPLLLGTNDSLTSIAYQAGFSDQSHFNRVFKLHFNMNPRTYRKQLLPKGKC